MSHTDPRYMGRAERDGALITDENWDRLLRSADYMDEAYEQQAAQLAEARALIEALEKKVRGVGHDWFGLMEQRDTANALVQDLAGALQLCRDAIYDDCRDIKLRDEAYAKAKAALARVGTDAPKEKAE